MSIQINERSRLPVTVKFADGDWLGIVPDTVRYRLDCKSTGRTILDWTDVTPANPIVITVTADQNAIVSDDNKFERKVLAVEANYGTGNQYTDSYEWKVKNLQGFT